MPSLIPNISGVRIDACLIRGAQICEGRCDVRYYLNGICLSKNGKVYGTNGHLAFSAKLPDEISLEDDWIIRLESKISLSTNYIKISFLNFKGGYITCYKDYNCTNIIKRIFFDVIEGKYPDIEKVIKPKHHPDDELKGALKSIWLNPDYLSLAGKIYSRGRNGVKFNFNGEGSPVVITSSYDDYESMIFIVMPLRM